MKKYCDFIKKAEEHGVEDAKIISTTTIEVGHWVRWKCRYGCDDYGERLTCPPHTPPVEETKKVMGEYRNALLLHGHTDPEMQEIVAILERHIFLAGYPKALGLACGPCSKCDECGDTCKKPEKARPSMEAVGIDVYNTVWENGYDIEVKKNKEECPDYFALVLIE